MKIHDLESENIFKIFVSYIDRDNRYIVHIATLEISTHEYFSN